MLWKTTFGKSLIFIPLQETLFPRVEKYFTGVTKHLFPVKVLLCFGLCWGKKWIER